MENSVTMWPEDSVSPHPASTTTLNASHGVSSGDKHAGGVDITIVNVDFWLAVVTVSTLSCLGILGNMLAIAVWQRAKGFNATLFLFKCLAGWDTAYLALTVLYNCILRDGRLASNMALVLSVYHVSGFVQMVSVHVTLLIAVTRWVLVKFPWRSLDLLASRRVYWQCGFIALYCAALQAAQVVFSIFYPHSTLLFIIRRILGLALPFLLLVVFNLVLLRTVTRHIRKLREMKMQTIKSETPTNSWSQSIDTSSASSEKEIRERAAQTRERPRQDSDDQWSRKQRMVKAVLLLSLCSFIAYPIGVSVQIFAVERAEPPLLTRYIILHVAHICQVINSGINALIYWGLIPRFRSLAKDLRRRLCARLCCTSAFDFSRR